MKIAILILFFISAFLVSAYPAEKNWFGSGDASTWEDQKNWFPATVPNSTDDTIVNLKDAAVTVNKTFESKTLTVGGAATSSLTFNDFVQGTITPASSSDNALYIRKGGTVTLKGNGIITLKGRFENSEESLSSEDSFMFLLE